MTPLDDKSYEKSLILHKIKNLKKKSMGKQNDKKGIYCDETEEEKGERGNSK